MAAQKSGGSAGRLRAKNQAMAQAMKTAGVARHTGRCPVCNATVGLSALYHHIIGCKGH